MQNRVTEAAASNIGCDIEVMNAADFNSSSFASFISARRPLLVRKLAANVAPRLVDEWKLANFHHRFGALKFETAPIGYPSKFLAATTHL